VTAYLVRRTGQAVVVLLLVTVIVFVLLHLLPGGAARAIIGERATATSIAAFNQEYGLDRPLPVQYVQWLGKLVRGDLGFSFKQNQSVLSLLGERLPKTAILAGISVLLSLLIAVPLGFLQALRRNRPLDYTVTGAAFVFYSTPAFWLGLILIEVFAVRLQILPSQAPQGSVGAILSQPDKLVLPVLTISLVTIAFFSRYMRSAALDNLMQDYVRTARAKGASTRRIVLRHVLRNSLIPIVTLLGLSLPFVLAGTLITEQVFNYPGTGLLFYNAAVVRDFPVLLGVTVVVGAATVLGSLLADLGYAALDPRVRYGDGR
jgi:peptide/nickel transport system permease protein